MSAWLKEHDHATSWPNLQLGQVGPSVAIQPGVELGQAQVIVIGFVIVIFMVVVIVLIYSSGKDSQ